MTRAEYRWLLPSDLAPDPAETAADRHHDPASRPAASDPAAPAPGPAAGGRRPPRARRTVRDWVVDILAFAFAALLGVLAAQTSREAGNGSAVVVADQLVAAAACCALWARRRWPVPLAAALSVLSVFAPATGGALLVALFTAAVRVPFRRLVPLGLLAMACSALSPLVRPDPSLSVLAGILAGTVLVLLVTGWGMLVRARRQLVVALRDRAARAEAEAELRAEQAQRAAREAIAREMHDVLAHRLTLLSVHAGALEFRPDAPPADVARAAGVIRDSAHEALQDLREIIGVLRAPGDADSADRPQPTLATLPDLVAESRAAGMRVTLDDGVADPARAPAATGRTVYRIAQEGLTNARKHAPGAEVAVTVRGGPGDGLTVEVTNPAAADPAARVPGAGQGLIGLAERAALAGGSLSHGPLPGGGFTVRAWLPWPA
ncbi:sensor histidine kinase [Streptomyces sp. ODS05-4]|uniref:sensor histidine kinase n=1 Tax=Streptomyces sp. ODS05-4 TaxID=2944939 RepID=UPI0021088E77|nr:histidine kinase [Streptomyces sp. ODS05-4]